MPRLRRSDCSDPGLSRRRRGRGFEYRDPGGDPVRDPETLERVRELAIPPAWSDVWVCPDPLGHLQATGVDAAGRRQYLYHPSWRAHRDRRKFEAMVDFGRALPRVRRAVARDLGRESLDRERVLACAVRLLDRGLFRIGSDSYASENGSYGLTTILKRHVQAGDGTLRFDYPAKAGIRRVQLIADADAGEVVSALKHRRGGSSRLLAYRGSRRWHDLHAEDVNEYLRDVSRQDCTAKEFRTWNGTVLAVAGLARREPHIRPTRAARERAIRAVTREVAEHLGNTPAVARRAYIDPRVLDRFRSGWRLELASIDPGDIGTGRERRRLERAVLELLG
ncbi:MAG: DNA topoisomerase IB [Solirubrobacteraceae bacterium]